MWFSSPVARQPRNVAVDNGEFSYIVGAGGCADVWANKNKKKKKG